MNANSDRFSAVLGLSRLPGIGRARLKAILSELGTDAERALVLRDVVERFRDRYFTKLTPEDVSGAGAQADRILERCVALDIAVHPFGCSSYPTSLLRLKEPPAILFSRGTLEAPSAPRIAVIGTRRPTEWGLQTAAACATQIAEGRGVVVSGLALGIDAAAQAACVASAAPTWAVLAHGLDSVSPASNRALADDILRQGGAWLSEYPPGERAQRHYFVERDRIQAGLSDAVLVIESDVNGGAMHTVRFAHEGGIPVWATFPQAKVREAEADASALPEPQRGTWDLLVASRATRVSSMRALVELMSSVVSPRMESAPDSLFAR